MSRTDLEKLFAAEKAKLNPRQRQAVETIEGPVMVLAGPGTGKTQVIAFRIAEILARGDTTPRNILALTFTDSGVTAMRQRLVSLIGATGYMVGIYTFHGFALRVMSESGADFFTSHTLERIDDIAQIKLVMRLIDKQNSPLIRQPRSPYFWAKPIVQAIKELKGENVSPQQLRRLAQDIQTTLANDPASLSTRGKTKNQLRADVNLKIERMARCVAVSELYENYQTEMTRLGRYDYEDMIRFVLAAFQNNPELKARYQEQFHYLLVDEYQDTNNAQNQIIWQLGDYFTNPNIFVVGDDKQSIYRFQGASTANLLDFRLWYPSAKIISLEENYRSGQAILDAADRLIRHNQEQLSTALPTIITHLKATNTLGTITFVRYADYDHEALNITEQIQSLIKSGVKASEIAVIYRQNHEAELFIDLFRRQGLNYTMESGNDSLGQGDVRELISLLRLAYRPDDEMALFRYLHAPYSGLSNIDLVTLSRWRRDHRLSWRDLLDGPEPPTRPRLTDWPSLQASRAKIDSWYRLQAGASVGEVAEHILRQSGLLTHLLDQLDYLPRLGYLRCFFNDLKNLMASTPHATLTDLFERIDIRLTYRLPLVCHPVIEPEADAVRLMTAHKAKGLEFRHVFVPHFEDKRWSHGQHPHRLELPATIVSHHHDSPQQELEEERRLAYVAITRAKESVHLSCATRGDERELLPAQFLAEMGNVPVATDSRRATLSLGSFFSPWRNELLDTATRNYLQSLVATWPITPTGINTYLTCPMEYLYRDVYAIPGVRSPTQAYGHAIHKMLEMWGKWSRSDIAVKLPQLEKVFLEALLAEGLSREESDSFQQLGDSVIKAYWETHRDSWVPPLAVEYNFGPHEVRLDGRIPITGKLDKIEPIPRSDLVRVVDYKTGRVRTRQAIEGKTADSDGDYKRQVVFYTILAECDPAFPYRIGEVAIAFIDDAKKFNLETFVVSSTEREELKNLIRHVYGEITQLNFDHTEHRRRWGKTESLCDLLRSDRRADSPPGHRSKRRERQV